MPSSPTTQTKMLNNNNNNNIINNNNNNNDLVSVLNHLLVLNHFAHQIWGTDGGESCVTKVHRLSSLYSWKYKLWYLVALIWALVAPVVVGTLA